jgi:hypothetical protein
MRRTILFQIAIAIAASVAAFQMAGVSAADATSCDLGAYKSASGLTAARGAANQAHERCDDRTSWPKISVCVRWA